MTYTASETIEGTFKRHLDDDDVEHFFKKRLLDNFGKLKIFEGSRNGIESPLAVSPMVDKGKDTVRIDSIDQFLLDNEDELDIEARPLESTEEVSGSNKIVIPSGLLKPLNEIFNEESQSSSKSFLEEKKRQVVDKIMSRKKAQQDKFLRETDKNLLQTDFMLDEGETITEPEIEISNDEIYYEAYLGRFWSLVKYYNPRLLVWVRLQKWLISKKREMFYHENDSKSDLNLHDKVIYKSDQIQELDFDGENVVMSDDEGMINNEYGDYYGEDQYREHDDYEDDMELD